MNEEFEVLNFEEPKKFSVLDTYGENLKTKFYLTDPAIGRDKEIKETRRGFLPLKEMLPIWIKEKMMEYENKEKGC